MSVELDRIEKIVIKENNDFLKDGKPILTIKDLDEFEEWLEDGDVKEDE
tara:strand:- start:35 stop:181 length:147 start_codon:yes stop_codon:yes gene_type:complete